jgi:8-oxo-dGTP pyrophosphatase MutT (NUDIX family)
LSDKGQPSLTELADRLRATAPPPPASDDAHAAVATILRSGPSGVEVLLIKRAERDGDPWSGHVAFPGGKRDPGDASLLDTAIRETLEEVGLALEARALVARLGDLSAYRNGIRVAQYVFVLDAPSPPLAVSTEVAATLWAPLDRLAELEAQRPSAGLPSLQFGSYLVWGMTYRMLRRLFDAGPPL